MSKIITAGLLIACMVLISVGCDTDKISKSTDSETTDVETAESDTTISESKESETTAFTLVTETIYETEGNLIRDLEYPQIVSEDNSYSEINETIKNMVIKLNSPDWEIDEDRELDFTCKYKIIYQNENILSIEFCNSFYAEGMMYLVDSRYGMTIDLNTLSIVTLDNYYENTESILNQIDTGNYSIVDGGLKAFSKEELKEEVLSILDNADMGTYMNNFYVDENSVYIIHNDLSNALGDYSIIKLPLETSPITE